MCLAEEKGFVKVEIVTDYKNVVDLQNSRAGEKTTGFHILCEMKDLATHFQGCKLLYASRTANMAAHRCAKESLLDVTVLDFSVPPGFLFDVIQTEKISPIE